DSVSGFERLAGRARQLGKPIVALKIGRSDQARQAAISHTASLSGSDAAASAFLARLGIARVGSLPAFCETLKLLHAHGPLPGAPAIPHTPSRSASDAAACAFLARLGIARVGSLPAFCETLKLLHVHGPLPGPRLSSMSCSGGEAGLIADAAAGRKVRFLPV